MNLNYYGTRDVTDAVGSSVSFDEDMLSDVLREIYEEEVKPQNGDIPSELYEATRSIFEKATAQGMAQSRNKRIATEEDFLRKYTHSIDVFSAFRVHKYASLMADMLHDNKGNLRSFEEWRNATASIQSHFNRNWLETEYNTAILRAEQAADWKRFEEDKDIMPNLKWMPTSSATPREEHAVFWREELTLPVDDPFWDSHRPGDLWNCKCYLQQTDAPATSKTDIPKKKDMPSPAPGLKYNPGKTAEMFDRSQPYYPDPQTCLWLKLAKQAKKSGAEAKSSRVVDAVKCVHNCNLCEYIQLLRKSDAESNRKLYEKMKLDKEYRKVEYDEESGAVRAESIHHNSTSKGTKFFLDENGGNGYSGTQLEKFCQDELFRMGHSCILMGENLPKGDGTFLTSLDAIINGRRMDIRSVTENTGNYRNHITAKNKQLKKWLTQYSGGMENSLCLYFHDMNFFSESKMRETIDCIKDSQRIMADLKIRRVLCVVRGANDVLEYEL